MTDQTNTPNAPTTAATPPNAQERAITSVRAGLLPTIGRMVEANNADLGAQGKQAPAQSRTMSNQGGRSVKLNAEGQFEHTVTHGTVDDTVNPDLSAVASRRSETSLLHRMIEINRVITDAIHFDPKTGAKKTHLGDEQYRKFGLEFEMLRRAYEAQTRTTADLVAREAHAEQLKQQAIEKEQAIKAYANGSPAREQAIRAHLADLEAAEVASTIYGAYRQ
jgi:hypothetical protein